MFPGINRFFDTEHEQRCIARTFPAACNTFMGIGQDGIERRYHVNAVLTTSGESTTATQIGPRRVNGRYRDGYRGEEYTVLEITTGAQHWAGWYMRVKWNDGRVTQHASAWNMSRDRIISQL